MTQPPPAPEAGRDRPGRAAVVAFVSRPASPRPLAWLRIGLAAVLLVQALSLGGSLQELYGERGVVQWSVVAAPDPPAVPRVGWVVSAMTPWGVSPAACVRGVFLAYLAGLACLLVGWHTRKAAAATWLTHLALGTSGTASLYGVDQFANAALFYCLWMPVGHALSADRRLGRVPGGPSFGARLGLRVLQVHLCIAYLAAGAEKLAGEQWRNGEAVWQSVMLPAFATADFAWLADFPWLSLLAGWATIVVELCYPIFIWPKATRLPWVAAVVGMHAGIAVALSLVSFSAVMIVLTVSAFAVPADPRPDEAGPPATPPAPRP